MLHNKGTTCGTSSSNNIITKTKYKLQITDTSNTYFGFHTTNHVALLKEQFPRIAGLHATASLTLLGLPPATSDTFVQIINLVGNHWIAVSDLLSPPDTVYVYDSSPNINSVLEAHIASFVSTNKRTISVHWPQLQRQHGSNECGLFSLACATTLCLGNDPCLFRYDQVRMRAHLM